MINKSLTCLGMVINSLTDGSSHIPYRESKLTRILQESLGGNSKTCLIITCSPSVFNESETLSTLRFGKRSKKIKNKPIINKEISVQELKLEIQKLEGELSKYKTKEKENNIKIQQIGDSAGYNLNEIKTLKIENLQINVNSPERLGSFDNLNKLIKSRGNI